MPFVQAGFVDHHAHLLRAAAGIAEPWGNGGHQAQAAWHRAVEARWSTPMDQEDPPLTVHDGVRGAFERVLADAAALGLVELTEAGVRDWAYLDALRDLRVRGPLPARVRLLIASGLADLDRMASARTGDPWLEIEGVSFAADGWLATRTAALREPFADEPEYQGVLFFDADTLASRADPFAEAGWTVSTHAVGDRAIETVLDAYDRLYGSDCAAAAPRVEHAQVLAPDLVRRMADMGVVVCIQPGSAVSDAHEARAALGGERWEDAYRWDQLLDAGVRVITGSGAPVEAVAPLVGLQRLVAGVDDDGRAVGSVTLGIEAGLAIMTDPTAGETVLSDDPRRVSEDELASIEVVEVRPAG